MAEYDVYQSKFRATEIDDLLTKIQSYDPSAIVSPTVEINESDAGSSITIIDKSGSHSTFIKNGIDGAPGETGEQGPKGDPGEQGVQGIQGPAGDPFEFYKIYPSIAEMQADFDNVPEKKIVLISSDISEEDNAKIFVRNETEFKFLTDLSGATGIDGPQGPQGVPGEAGTSVTASINNTVKGEHTVTLTDKDGEKSFTILDGVSAIDDTATSGTNKTWSITQIVAYVQKVLEDIENGTY